MNDNPYEAPQTGPLSPQEMSRKVDWMAIVFTVVFFVGIVFAPITWPGISFLFGQLFGK
jgi:hypothetical protein